MLRAYSILDDVKRDDGSVQDIEDPTVRLRLGGSVHLDSWYGSGGEIYFDNARSRKTANIFMPLMQEVDPKLHGRIWVGDSSTRW